MTLPIEVVSHYDIKLQKALALIMLIVTMFITFTIDLYVTSFYDEKLF